MKLNKLLIALCLFCVFAIHACDKDEDNILTTDPEIENPSVPDAPEISLDTTIALTQNIYTNYRSLDETKGLYTAAISSTSASFDTLSRQLHLNEPGWGLQMYLCSMKAEDLKNICLPEGVFTVGNDKLNTFIKDSTYAIYFNGHEMNQFILNDSIRFIFEDGILRGSASTMQNGRKVTLTWESGPFQTDEKEEPVKLVNQYDFNNEIHEIISVQQILGEECTSFLLQEESKSGSLNEKPAIEIQLSNALIGKEINLETVEHSSLKLFYQEENIPLPAIGSLKIRKEKLGHNFVLTGNIQWGEKKLRLHYKGEPQTNYASKNCYTINNEKGNLLKLFRVDNGTGGSSEFAFGTIEVAKAEDLVQGTYAVCISLSASKLGKGTIDLATEANSYSLQLMDYTTKKVFTADEGITGELTTYEDPQENGGRIYLKLNATLSDGQRIEAEYFGETTPTSNLDVLVPAPNKENSAIIMDADGVTEIFNHKITSVEIRETTKYYECYFMTDISTKPDDIYTTPYVKIAKSLVTGESVDLSKTRANTWAVSFLMRFNLTSTDDGYTPMALKGRLKAKIDDSQCDFYLELANSYKNQWEGSEPTGSNETLYIYFKGPRSPYSGN